MQVLASSICGLATAGRGFFISLFLRGQVLQYCRHCESYKQGETCEHAIEDKRRSTIFIAETDNSENKQNSSEHRTGRDPDTGQKAAHLSRALFLGGHFCFRLGAFRFVFRQFIDPFTVIPISFLRFSQKYYPIQKFPLPSTFVLQ